MAAKAEVAMERGMEAAATVAEATVAEAAVAAATVVATGREDWTVAGSVEAMVEEAMVEEAMVEEVMEVVKEAVEAGAARRWRWGLGSQRSRHATHGPWFVERIASEACQPAH